MAKKYAIQTYTRDKNGVLKATLVDAATGEPVTKSNQDEYDVVTSTDYDTLIATGKLPSAGSDTGNKKEDKKPTLSFGNDTSYNIRNANRGERGSNGYKNTSEGKSTRTGANNFGYKKKPGLVSAASFIPGVGGILGKAVNLGWNANNVAAVNAARKAIGMPELSTKDQLKGVIKDNEGYLGKTKIGTKNYGVQLGSDAIYNGGGVTGGGFLDKVKGIITGDTTGGQTNLTISEAQKRQALSSAQTAADMTGLTSAEKNAERMAGRQKTFGKVSPQQNIQKANYQEAYGAHRPNRPSQDIIDAVTESAANVLGPGSTVIGTSGEGEYGSPRHREKTGAHGLDFKVKDPNGNIVSDPAVMGRIAVDVASHHPNAGIGYDANYMGLDTMHVDLSGMGGVWGAGNHRKGMNPELAARIDAARQNPVQTAQIASVPTPTSRPDTGFGFIGAPNTPSVSTNPNASAYRQYESYIRDAAVKRGINPDIAVAVAKTEGLQEGTWQSTVPTKTGTENSFGPFQLNMDGGLGAQMKKDWGLDPSDPKNALAGIDYALDYAAENGWGAFHGAANNGIGEFDGLQGAKALGHNSLMTKPFSLDEATKPFADYARSYYDRAQSMVNLAADAIKSTSNTLGNEFAGGLGKGFSSSFGGSNRPASGGMNNNNFGGNRNSLGTSSGMGNRNNGNVGMGNANSVGSGGFSGSSNFGRGDTPSSGRGLGGLGNGNTNTHTSGGNTNSLGGGSAGTSFGGNNNTNNNSGNSNDNNDNEGATGRYGYGGFGGPR